MRVPKISAIIPVYRGGIVLKDAIHSLQKQNLPPEDFEIVIIDNSPYGKVFDQVNSYNNGFSKKIIYERESLIGLHYARHKAAKVAKGTILAFTDEDAIVSENWLQELLSSYKSDDIGCVGGKILPKWEESPPSWVTTLPSAYLSLLDYGEAEKEVDEIYGCNFSIRRYLLFKLGGFNPDSYGAFWLGDGETGLQKKVEKSGFKIIYNPKAIVWHVVPKERLTLKYAKRRFFNEGACSSYSQYKENKFNALYLFARSIYFLLNALFCKMLAIFFRIKKNSKFVMREVKCSFFLHRCLYEFRLIYNNELRRLVLKERWLE